MSDRLLIVNADDFGRAEAINEGVAIAFERGVVTSASLMVRWPDAEAAARWACGRKSFSLGLHFDLGEWAFRHREWCSVYSVVPDDDDASADQELSRQLGMFLRMTGRPPTHLDSHQNVHLREPLQSRVRSIGERLRIPVRGFSPQVRYCGAFYGQWHTGEPLLDGISVDGLLQTVDSLGQGTTELSCHPATSALSIDSMYVSERAVELETLCDPRVPQALRTRGVSVRSFRDLEGQ
jgi:predicted glycoside hydrolase/deacetylase ChbG (UPF0249 family)